MATKIKYFIRVQKSNPNDLVNVRIRFTNGRIFDLTALTGFQIYPEFWNNDKGAVRQRIEFHDREKFQRNLEKLTSFIQDRYFNTPDKSIVCFDWLRDTIDRFHNPTIEQDDKLTLFGFIKNFIENSSKRVNRSSGNPVCYKMRREYEVSFDYLKEYSLTYGKPDFDDIDIDFYNQFVDFLRNKGLAINTIGKKVQTLKIFLNDATEKGINKNLKYKSPKFKTLTEECDNIYLNKDELKKFYEYDLSDKPSLERVRDVFIVGCWTALRYSDLSKISIDKINNGILQIRHNKTGRKINIPIHKNVWEILRKYNMALPRKISNQKYNDYLKEAAMLAGIDAIFTKTHSKNGIKVEEKFPKYQLIRSHTARRTFCTNAYKDNIPILDIMAISGHKSISAFLKYIKVDGEEQAQRVLKFWKEND